MDNKTSRLNDVVIIILYIIGALFLANSVFLSFAEDIWYDELFSLSFANLSVSEMVSMTARDVHPPLYYLLLKLFIAFFDGTGKVVAAKLFSVVCFVILYLIAVFALSKRFGKMAGALFMVVILAMPQMLAYTVEIRMYALALLLVTIVYLKLYDYIRSQKKADLILACLAGVLTGYTHYFALIATAGLFLFFLICKLIYAENTEDRKRIVIGFIKAVGVMVLAYMPWFVVAVSQIGEVKANYWIPPVSLKTIGGCIKYIFYSSYSNKILNLSLTVLGFLGVVVLIVLCLQEYIVDILSKRKALALEDYKNSSEMFAELGGVFALVFLVFTGIILSIVIRPIFVYRYMLPALGVFWLSVSVIISRRKSNIIIFVALILLCLYAKESLGAFQYEESKKLTQMSEVRNAFSEISADDIIICNFDQVQGVVAYYLQNESYLYYGNPEVLIKEMYPMLYGIEDISVLLDECDRSGGQVWFLGTSNAREDIIADWESEYDIISEKVNSALLERYWIDFYKLSYKGN